MDAATLTQQIADGTVVFQRSARRAKTIEARRQHGRIVIRIPARLRVEDHLVTFASLVTRLQRAESRMKLSDADLFDRSSQLNSTYFDDGIIPGSVRWVSNQNTRWASTSVHTGAIRISDRLQHVPGWVLDSVLVHELAHLREGGHGPAFQELAQRYPRTAEAEVYLAGFSQGRRSVGGEE